MACVGPTCTAVTSRGFEGATCALVGVVVLVDGEVVDDVVDVGELDVGELDVVVLRGDVEDVVATDVDVDDGSTDVVEEVVDVVVEELVEDVEDVVAAEVVVT